MDLSSHYTLGFPTLGVFAAAAATGTSTSGSQINKTTNFGYPTNSYNTAQSYNQDTTQSCNYLTTNYCTPSSIQNYQHSLTGLRYKGHTYSSI